MVGRLVVVPVRPLVPAVGLLVPAVGLLLLPGLIVVPLPSVRAEALPDMLPEVGRLAVILPLFEPLVRPLPETLAPLWLRPSLLGKR